MIAFTLIRHQLAAFRFCEGLLLSDGVQMLMLSQGLDTLDELGVDAQYSIILHYALIDAHNAGLHSTITIGWLRRMSEMWETRRTSMGVTTGL